MKSADHSPIQQYAATAAPAIDRVHAGFHQRAGGAFRESGLERPPHAGLLISLRFAIADRPLPLPAVKLAFRYSAPGDIATAVTELTAVGWLHTDGEMVHSTERTVAWINALYDLHAQVATSFWEPAPTDLAELATLAARLLTAAAGPAASTVPAAAAELATETGPAAATGRSAGAEPAASTKRAAASSAAGSTVPAAAAELATATGPAASTEPAAASSAAGSTVPAAAAELATATEPAASTGPAASTKRAAASSAAGSTVPAAAAELATATGPAASTKRAAASSAAGSTVPAAAAELATATEGRDAVFAALSPPYERAGDPPGLLLFNRLAVLRYHRADAHAAAWAAAGLTAQAMQALPPGDQREAIEAETNRLAAPPFEALTDSERRTFLDGLNALPA